MAKSYSDKLKDPRWQRKRLEIFDRDNWMCVKCSDVSNTLHVHHKVYYPNTDPWMYQGKHLETLCVVCHQKEHDLIQVPEIKEWHWQIREHGDSTLTAIQTHIDILMLKLSKGVPRELEDEILKNVIYLQQKKKEYQNGTA